VVVRFYVSWEAFTVYKIIHLAVSYPSLSHSRIGSPCTACYQILKCNEVVRCVVSWHVFDSGFC